MTHWFIIFNTYLVIMHLSLQQIGPAITVLFPLPAMWMQVPKNVQKMTQRSIEFFVQCVNLSLLS